MQYRWRRDSPMTSLAMDNANHPEQVQDYLHKIALSSKHLLGLINDVLDISKIESSPYSHALIPKPGF